MEIIDEHSAIESMEQLLASAKPLIDGRTETDWFRQLTDIASLLNFYDHENKVSGSWNPFLLKDPVFLLASISKTDFIKFKTAYTDICGSLQGKLQPDFQTVFVTVNFSYPGISYLFNKLLDLFLQIFLCIREWVYFMELSSYEYSVKTYTVKQVTTVFSAYLWAFISLRQNLFLYYGKDGITPGEHDKLYLFSCFNKFTWDTNKDKKPYWEILEINSNSVSGDFDIKTLSPADLFRGLKKAGDELFHFFHSIIHNAAGELKVISTQKSKYPDTLLLRTFIAILKNHQQQLNGIEKKYFRFYYRDILKQRELPAVPDQVFICADLAKKDAAFQLPAGTLFDGGPDAANKPVTFSSTENASLNPAAIKTVTTLAITGTDSCSQLNLQNISGTGSIKVDETGAIQSWETFGGTAKLPANVVKQAISFASPLLLLREGERTITVTLVFPVNVPDGFPAGAVFYLSTANGWLKVLPAYVVSKPAINNQLKFTIGLTASQPPIIPFSKNKNGLDADGLDSSWPMLKIEFNSFSNIPAAPVITSIIIEVTVSGAKTFQLSNDYGGLDSTKPYQLFGPAPLLNNSFVIGSDEIFSKPVEVLLMEFDWDNLPGNFSTYYKQYNDYLNDNPATAVRQGAKKKSFISRLLYWGLNPVIRIWQRVKNLFKKNQSPVPPPMDISGLEFSMFNNSSFAVNFKILQEQQWIKTKLERIWTLLKDNIDLLKNSFPVNKGDNVYAGTDDLLLFTTDDNSKLVSSSQFAYSKSFKGNCFIPDPFIQQTPLKFTPESTSGFMKMSLISPGDGFGSLLYANVVSSIAFKNAWALLNPDFWGDMPKFIQPANLPFAPKLTSFTACYSASHEYAFDSDKNKYPLQCFLYAPFSNYKIYDNYGSGTKHTIINKFPGTKIHAGINGVPLFQSFIHKGYLFLELENVSASNEINIFFELVTRADASGERNDIMYYYLSSTGWKKLPVLSDGNAKFTQSGILKVNVPRDITNAGNIMPGNNYWLCIAVNEQASSFAQTVFLKTNGILLKRFENVTLSNSASPVLAAGAIKKSKTALPQIAAITQPFPSFGGKAIEDELSMNRRISSLIKTKDRAIVPGDYYTLIRRFFPEIYYSATVIDYQNKQINVLVVKGCESATAPAAFIPLVNATRQAAIQQFLADRGAVFFKIRVSNFELLSVKITAQVTIKTGYNTDGMKKEINNALNIYLSPWIAGDGLHIPVARDVDNAQIAARINKINGVSGVTAVSVRRWKYNGDEKTEVLFVDGELITSCMNHNINCIAEK